MNPQMSSANLDHLISPVHDVILQVNNLSVSFHNIPAIQGIDLKIYQNQVTSFIGPSGVGKSTLLRCFNRLNELLPHAEVSGDIRLAGQSIWQMHPVELRRKIGMVFQRPNPFPKSIYDNVAIGLRVNRFRGDIEERVERSLQRVGLWNDVKDRLRQNALNLSGGQQQRLCIARAIALNPTVLLMDEPCSSLDPIATLKIEELICDLSANVTIVIVTHNMQQASRVSDYTAFFNTDDQRIGHVVEFGTTAQIFRTATQRSTRDYIEGRFG